MSAPGVSVLHIGDFLIHMKVGVRTPGIEGPKQLRQLAELIEPRYFIPIHYRTDRVGDPIPPGNWPPDVTDVAAFIESMRETIGDVTELMDRAYLDIEGS